MAKNYQWKTDAIIISGGYPGEETGITPSGSTDWHTTDVLSGNTAVGYFFRDSASSTNSNSSRVVIDATESWTASISSTNVLTISITTTINSIYRDDVRGNPGTGGSQYRDMYLRRSADSQVLWSITNDDITTAHTILGSPLSLGTYTFTIEPGGDFSKSSIYFRNNVAGHGSDPVPSIYVDEMWVGTSFRNILPKDFRPGATLNSNTSIWWSHNRTNGACHVLSSTSPVTWQECRTVGDGTDQGNPPLILHAANANSWYNQKLLGKQN